MKIQKAFILIVSPQVVGNAEEGNNQFNNLQELNQLLSAGWTLVSATPMSAAECRYSVSLVILEKDTDAHVLADQTVEPS